jgi:hypothetical protein
VLEDQRFDCVCGRSWQVKVVPGGAAEGQRGFSCPCGEWFSTRGDVQEIYERVGEDLDRRDDESPHRPRG